MKPVKKQPRITIETLAHSVANGFSEVKSDIKSLEKKLDERFDAVDKKLDDVDSRLTTVEALLASNRIERLEDSMRQVKTLLKLR